MTTKNRLIFYLKECDIHINRLKEVLTELKKLYPIDYDKLENFTTSQKDKLDVLAFRFSKLKDILVAKIFRKYLEYPNYPVQDKNFLEILKELSKKNIVDIDKWAEFRAVRNSIAHDYPYNNDEKIEAINYLIQNKGKN
ncbi:MAG: hypothetical protein ABGX26_01085 [Nautiliaceae bacterium]